ncbi:hypothetical protein HOP50_02g18260 [Chloropicon primus]|uniref:Uncharacterized protein n=1 Tax=Chloropicon primus TaxID=1764295 RepID=A0A5B8MG59_9CHLO|nr:hypothetical protein A3770_02p18290 [Chloropicon primus]UPQ98520.1 hypothetical protein HOP50_02g18260 [Chloropicon primus]|mmetsp:Transcript_724/g.2148  ORF Transcript_724/g.2148 Transcript_724/m.2148 type:complete len:215 (+) Transcript_724:105-749(+)|eukprot:QDZ19311.1 hypothetical protein A3770_02p18290 [Chloropicon primus]
MAANPPLVMGANGLLTPAPFAGEHFVLGRDGVQIEVNNVRTSSGKWKADGYLFVSHVRCVFVAPKADSSGLQSFDFPLAYVSGEKFNQPIFGCNNLSMNCFSVGEGGGPNGAMPPHGAKFYLKNGGSNTLLPLFFRLLEVTRIEQRRAAEAAQQAQYPAVVHNVLPQVSEVTKIVNTAYVDPSDPTTIYVTQPVGQDQVMRDEEKPYEPTGLKP